MIKNKILIYHHLGLGDCIECNGMVRFYCEKYQEVEILCKDKYYEMVEYMYRDLSNLKIHVVAHEQEHQQARSIISKFDGEILIPGHANYFNNIQKFKNKKYGPAESFYELASVPWSYRNQKFYFERDPVKEQDVYNKMNPENEKYVFVHDDIQRGFHIPLKSPYKIIRNDNTVNMLDMIKLFEKAEEIHCMSSSILCLIDCLSAKVNFPKLFLHNSIRSVPLGPDSLQAEWKII